MLGLGEDVFLQKIRDDMYRVCWWFYFEPILYLLINLKKTNKCLTILMVLFFLVL